MPATQSDKHMHVQAWERVYIGINVKGHHLYYSGELLGSVIGITINRSFHRSFSKRKYKCLLMLTTLLKHSWAENAILNKETETNDFVIQTKILSAAVF